MQRGSLIGLGFIALYLMGLLFPQAMWGLDSLAYLPLTFQIGIPVLALLGIVFGEWWARQSEKKPARINSPTTLRKWSLISGIALLAALLFYFNPIPAPVYGDAAKFDQAFSSTHLQGEVVSDFSLILDPNIFHPKVGERTVLNTVLFISETLHIDHLIAFRLFGAAMGFLFVLLWLYAGSIFTQHPRLQILMALAGLSSSFTLLFCGHLEIYAPVFVGILVFLLAALRHIKQPEWRSLLAMSFTLFFALKVHSSSFLLFPAFGLALAHSALKSRPHLAKFFHWKWVSLFLLLPIFLGGAALYFFVLQDHADPRFLNPDISVYERLFLPLLSPEAPLDRYNLLSGNHLLDYFNLLLSWSLGSLFVAVTLLLTQHKNLRPQDPGLITVGVTLLLYAAFFFMVNPLLSMPIDWDLLALPAPVLLMFVLLLASQAHQAKLARQATGGVIAMALLGLSFFWVNTHRESLGQRLENIGQHGYRTYWIRSARVMEQGWTLQDLPPAVMNARRESAIARLEPYAVRGKDVEYAFLLTETGKYYRKTVRDNAVALPWHLKAQSYAPKYKANLIGLLECYFFAKDWNKAYPVAKDLITIQYPSQAQSLAIGVQIALEAENYAAAAAHCTAYLALKPGDAIFAEISGRLRAQDRVRELRTLFNQW